MGALAGADGGHAMQAEAEKAAVAATACGSAPVSRSASRASAQSRTASLHSRTQRPGSLARPDSRSSSILSTAHASAIHVRQRHAEDGGRQDALLEVGQPLAYSRASAGPSSPAAPPFEPELRDDVGADGASSLHAELAAIEAADDASIPDSHADTRRSSGGAPSLAATFCEEVKAKILRLQREVQRREDSIAGLHVQMQRAEAQHACAPLTRAPYAQQACPCRRTAPCGRPSVVHRVLCAHVRRMREGRHSRRRPQIRAEPWPRKRPKRMRRCSATWISSTAS